MTPEKLFTGAQRDPFQRSTRDGPLKFWVKAHTSFGESAPAATTSSFFTLGKATLVQVVPVSRHAVALAPDSPLPSNAQPVVLPVATSAVNWPLKSVLTDLTMCHFGAAAGRAEVPAKAAVPVIAPSAITPAPTAAAAASHPRPRTLITRDIFRFPLLRQAVAD